MCACIDVCGEAVSACEPVSVCLCVPSPFQVAVCMHLPCPQRLFPSPAHFCLQPGTLLPRGLQAMFLAATPSGSQGCFFVHCPWPKPGEAFRGRHSAQAEAVLLWAPEVIRSSADESESPVRAASYPVPAGAGECHLIVRTIVTTSWAVGGPRGPKPWAYCHW